MLRSVSIWVFNQLGTASLGCFRIYRETLSRFVSCAASTMLINWLCLLFLKAGYRCWLITLRFTTGIWIVLVITSVPTTQDETKALDAKIGEVAVVAKRKKDKWFVGAIANGKKRKRERFL
ncbi:glycoside hydrolase family 97 C-terminal domain-containing protein, partial [Pedobacter steynii]